MRLRSTLVLIVVLLGLGAYVYWVEYPKQEEEAKKKTVLEFKADDATAVKLQYLDQEIDLTKTGDQWRLTKPMDVLADQTAVKNLVTAVAECELKKEVKDASSDLSTYGLDKPLVTVTITAKDKDLPGVVVGKNTPVGFSTYLKLTNDPKILLTSSAFRSGMDKKVKDLRDKTIVSFADADVQKIHLWSAGNELTLVRKDDNWTIDSPGPYAADPATVRSLLSTLRSLRATDFPSDNPTDLSQYGLDNPRLKVTLTVGKDNAETRVLIGKAAEKNELYVQASSAPTVFTASDWIFKDLNKSVGDLRDKTVLDFDRDKLTAIAVKRKDGADYKLVRGADKQWKVEGNDGKPAETTFSQFLTDLHDLKGYEILADNPGDLAQFGLDQPLVSFTLSGEGDHALGTILLAPRPGGEAKKEYTGMAQGGPTVFLVRDYLVTRLNKVAQDFVVQPTPTLGAGTPPPQPEDVGAGPEDEDDAGDAGDVGDQD